MFDSDLSKITESDLLSFFDRKVPEDKTLEYKKEIKIDGEDRREFLGDISSFANSLGGTVLYGIYAKDGVPEKMDGIVIPNTDSFILQVENILRDSIKPRIDFSIALVKIANGNYVFLVRIRESFVGPHGVVSGKHYKFFHRGNGGKSEFDLDQLRDAFLGSSTLVDKIRDFRIKRVFDIESGNAPINLSGKNKIIIHIIPRESFTSGFSLNQDKVHLIRNDPQSRLRPPYASSQWNSPSVNFDGYLSWAGDSEKDSYHSYTQIFRNGIIEGVETYILTRDGTFKAIPSQTFEEQIYDFIQRTLSFQKDLGINLPVYVFITLTNIKGQTISMSNNLWKSTSDPIKQNDILLPEVIVSDFEVDVPSVFREVIDLVWNAGGVEKSIFIDNDGNWNTNIR